MGSVIASAIVRVYEEIHVDRLQEQAIYPLVQDDAAKVVHREKLKVCNIARLGRAPFCFYLRIFLWISTAVNRCFMRKERLLFRKKKGTKRQKKGGGVSLQFSSSLSTGSEHYCRIVEPFTTFSSQPKRGYHSSRFVLSVALVDCSVRSHRLAGRLGGHVWISKPLSFRTRATPAQDHYASGSSPRQVPGYALQVPLFTTPASDRPRRMLGRHNTAALSNIRTLNNPVGPCS